MVTLRNTLRLVVGIALVVFVVGGLTGCAITGPCDSNVMTSSGGCLPPNLPADPEPCTKYCKVWVPPTYRPKPKVVMTRPGYTRQVQGCKMEARYQEICVKPRETRWICEPGQVSCEDAVVQVSPGGYKWKDAGCGCYRYCYEPPVYQWCNKVVTEEGIDYCTERPPEYEMKVWHEKVPTCRQEYVPAEYGVCWEKEVFIPGHWEWQAVKECPSCDCPQVPPPSIPFRPQPCRAGVVQTCPTTN
jgi:hypothetical protein